MLAQRTLLRLARNSAAARQFSTARVLASAETKPLVDPNDPQISPDIREWADYKNEYYRKRGFTVVDKSWKEWEDLPAPYRYLGVKVDPAHVENHGPFWSFMSDWRQGVPAAMLLAMPLWMFNLLPPFDERLELALITVAAGWVAVKQGGPMFRQWKRARVAVKAKALLQHEQELNEEIAASIDTFRAGSSVVEYIRAVNNGERALRAVEAQAATRKIANAQRDSLVEQLDYLVGISANAAADTEAAVLKAARTNVEAALEKDSALQQRTLDAAIKALKEGALALNDDVVPGVWDNAVAKAKADVAKAAASGATTSPLQDPAVIEIFRKRFGYSDASVTETDLKRAQVDPSAAAMLTGKVGGKAPAVGTPFVLKAPITYLKK